MIKLAVPSVGIEELDEIRKVLDSKYLVQGDKVEEFEQMISEYLNVKHVIAVSSGTAALHLALIAAGIGLGDEVIVPDFTFPATANVIELIGGVTKFVDIKLDNYCIDSDKIEEKITKKTKAIIPVHEFGQSANMNEIKRIAEKYNIKVIEDAACALGARYNEMAVGTIGDIGCFSFHPRKAITTGEGGVVVTNNFQIAKKIRVLRNHGIDYGNGKIEFQQAGFNYRMTNIQGAIGVAQMKKLDNIIKERRKISNLYNDLLMKIPQIILPEEKSYGEHVYQTYHVLLHDSINRDFVIKKLKECGIETNIGAYAVHEQPYYKLKYGCCDEEYTNSIFSYQHGIALPLYYGLSEKDIIMVVNALNEILDDCRIKNQEV